MAVAFLLAHLARVGGGYCSPHHQSEAQPGSGARTQLGTTKLEADTASEMSTGQFGDRRYSTL